MNKINFIHTHVHSYFSLLDGLSSPADLAKTAAEMGFSGLALTDHGSCAGLLAFQNACKEVNIKPILGCEFYTTADHRNQTKDSNTYHLILLAKNEVGIKNMMHLATHSERYGKYKKPRIDFEMLANSHEGLICSTACSAGELAIKLLNGDEVGADHFVEQYKSLFKDDFYIEIMMHKYHEGSKDQEEREKKLAHLLYDLGKKHSVKVIATNDAHYAKRTDAKYQDVLLAMQTHDHIKNPKRFTFDGDEFYLKPYEEMQTLYAHVPDVLSNTMEIFEKIEAGPLLVKHPDLLPNFNLPAGYKDEASYLKDLVKDGMKSKGLMNIPEYRTRIKFEMDNIIKCGYIKYFLVLWDIISFARRQKIRIGVGRGCFVPGNKVDCKDGVRYIENVKIGDSVLAYDGKHHEVVNTMSYDIDEEIIEIEMEDGRKISCTLDHKIHIKRNKELIWVKASELTEEDDIYDIRVGD